MLTETVPLKAASAVLIAVDPLDLEGTAMLMPFVFARVLTMAQGTDRIVTQLARMKLGHVVAGDPNTLLLAVMKKNAVIGHTLAWLEGDAVEKWVWVLQCALDEAGVVPEVLAYLDAWGKTRGAVRIEMATLRNPKAWEKAHGFTVRRIVMQRPIAE